MITVHTDFNVPYTTNSYDRAYEGEVRAVNGELQVYDGATFQTIRIAAWVDDIDLETVVEWAKQKMEKELREQALAEQFPAFAKAKENYETVKALVENEMD